MLRVKIKANTITRLLQGLSRLISSDLTHPHASDPIGLLGRVNYATYPYIGGNQRIDLEANAITRESIVASITKNLSDTLLLGLHILRREDSARMEIRAIALAMEATLLHECILGVKMLGNTAILDRLRETAYT